MELSDTSSWLPLDGLATGFDQNKATPTGDLDGQLFTIDAASYAFDNGELTWTWADDAGTDAYEAFAVDHNLYLVQFYPERHREQAVSLVLDLENGHALTVVSSIGEADRTGTRVGQTFRPGRIAGCAERGAQPAPTTALVGRRALWIYSAEHAYEHVYLSGYWYSWQCLAGPERGLADTDENTTYELRPGIYLFAWREKVVPCAAITVADHRTAGALRSHGALFGLDGSGRSPMHFSFGAHGRLLSITAHPYGLDPALIG